MSIVNRMALHSFAGRLRIKPEGLNIADDERDGIRAALRAVKPEDVTDKMLNAYAKALEDNADAVFTERARRALAAAIAAGAEQ